jgi:predicted nucleic acid-binding Zn ribbon protein
MASRGGGRFPAKWTAARRLLKEWRGFDPDERPDRSGLVSEFLGKLLPELSLDSRIKEADIIAAWKGIVGDFIAQHSHPERLVGGILQVRVLQPSVRYELDRTWKPEILRKLREQFGEKTIRDLKFIL